jgi:hypothetical protein
MKSRLAVFAWSLLVVTGAFASTTNDLFDAKIQGRNLAQQLCQAHPVESCNNTGVFGVLIIRDTSGSRTNIPVKFEIIVIGTNWSGIYETTSESKPVTNGLLMINHQADRANRYELYKDGELRGAIEILRGNQIMIPFAGSDFWVADLGLEFFHWPEQKILKSEMRRSRSCKVLESTNPNSSTNGYSRVVSWIDNESGGIVHAEAYDANGKLLKEFDPKSFKKVNGQWELQDMEIRNVQTGSRTRLEFDLKAH